MPAVRIVAHYKEKGATQQGYRVILTGKVDRSGRLEAGEWPGWYVGEGARAPFVFRPGRREGVLDYGSGYTESTNLGSKRLKPGVAFDAGGESFEVVHADFGAAAALVQVTAQCVDPGRESHGLVILCPLEGPSRLVQLGNWPGYATDGEKRLPLMLSWGTSGKFDYGEWKERTTLKTCREGDMFSITSEDPPEEWNYRIVSCTALEPVAEAECVPAGQPA